MRPRQRISRSPMTWLNRASSLSPARSTIWGPSTTRTASKTAPGGRAGPARSRAGPDGTRQGGIPGGAGRVLVDAARTLNAQMIVLATRGETAARLLGAVSQYVLRHAPCPVLVVPEASKGL